MSTSVRRRAAAGAVFALAIAGGAAAQADDYIYLQSKAPQPITVVILRLDRTPCGRPLTLVFGNRQHVPTCGKTALIGLNDGVANTFTPADVGHIYEIYASGGRWKVRGADAR